MRVSWKGIRGPSQKQSKGQDPEEQTCLTCSPWFILVPWMIVLFNNSSPNHSLGFESESLLGITTYHLIVSGGSGSNKVWQFERKCPTKVMALLKGVVLLEKMCHRGGGL